MKQQRGFTLLELMVAMAIFAMLAVAGWQVFDGVNRARERAQFHADNLAVLQYAYLQLQQDMGQIIPYQEPITQDSSVSTNATSSDSNQANTIEPEPFMSLDDEHVSFIRFADPDPRYQNSASLQRVEYIFADERLIRRQYTSIDGGRDSISLDSVLLDGITAGSWHAYLPELSTKFPDENSSSNNNSTNRVSGQAANSASIESAAMLIPKGIAINFTYQDMPITWQWALAPQPISSSGKNKPNRSNDGIENGNNNGGANNSDSINNGTANGGVENSNPKGSI